MGFVGVLLFCLVFDHFLLFSFLRQGVYITLAVLEQYVDQSGFELPGIHLCMFPHTHPALVSGIRTQSIDLLKLLLSLANLYH